VRAATAPRGAPERERLLVVDTDTAAYEDAHIADLGRFLRRGDLVVVNDAATYPASLAALREGNDALVPFEVRLVRRGIAWAEPEDGAPRGSTRAAWTAALLGPGSYRTRTEDRPPPPRLAVGDRLMLGDARTAFLHAEVVRLSPISPALVVVAFREEGAEFWRALYAAGRPIQYAYVPTPLDVWDVQTAYAGRPVAAEMPSAGRPLTWRVLEGLRARGVRLATLTHATGVSSTGDARIDARLPLREAFDIPWTTARAVSVTRREGGRVVAVGTSVVRALESAAAGAGGAVRAGPGETDLVLGTRHTLRAVDALFTGMHERGASHFGLLRAFADDDLLTRAYAHADAAYLGHEFGDSMLLAPGLLPQPTRAA
jgi:S-adenosylmethionine:tRNA ribosyltransferase-isomerase